MRILVINVGSSTVKFCIFDMHRACDGKRKFSEQLNAVAPIGRFAD